jgi:L-aspartate oxidase
VNPGADPDNPTVALITEAVRGEGAVLRTASGEALMAGRHPLADLAPRDIVAAAITEYLQASGEERVWLDARRIPDFKERFPTVYATCQQAGIDPVAELIPVVPAAHYQCGGILTDANGRTDVPGLYAIGEVARTGLHGANRLASNSLVEGLVLGERAAADLHEHLPVGVDPKVSPDGGAGLDAFAATTAPAATGWTRTLAPAPLRPEQLSRLRAELSAHLGMLRRGTDLLALTGWLGQEVAGTLPGLTALAIATAANERAESRGCHRRVDHPDTEPDLARSVSWRLADPKDPLSLRAEALPAPGPTH